MMLQTRDFRSLCDRTTDEIARHLDDLAGIYRMLGLDAGQGMKRTDVSDHLASEIRSHLPSNLIPFRHLFRRMRHALILAHVLEGVPLTPYFPIASAIHDAARPGGVRRGFSDSPDWDRVVALGRHAADLLPAAYNLPAVTNRQMYGRAYAVADAALRMVKLGFRLGCQDDVVRFADGEQERVAEAIEKHVRQLGGVECSRRLVELIAPRYDPSMERFHLVRHVDAMGLDVRPDVPVGYLFHLAAKHVRPDPVPVDAAAIWEHLLSLATDFAAIHDLQPHSIWELEFKDDHTLISFLTELALYDSFFCLRQLRPRDVPPLIAGLFDWVPKELETAVGWRVLDAAALADSLIATVPEVVGGTMVEVDRLSGLIPEEARAAVPTVFAAFCHDPVTVNRDFRLPTSRPFPDLLFRPIIGLRPGAGVLLNFPASGPAFYEAVAAALRKIDRHTDDKVGIAAERYLENQLLAHGVTTLRGKYYQAGIDGECDFVIETPKVVILLEMKKKPLTRAAQAGGDLDIIVDVAGSLFDAQLQTNGHELLLREHGSLLLVGGDGKRQELALRGRAVEKVAVTLLDYGAFQDRTVLFQIFAVCVGRSFESSHSAIDAKKIEALNRTTRKLHEQFKRLGDFDPRYQRQPFFNCWFLSLPQLLVMLDRVNSNEFFWNELKSTRHITSHSLDWYVDYAYAQRF